MTNSEIIVENNEAASQYEARIDGLVATVQYELAADRITFLHTDVPTALEGRGIGSALVRAALDDARKRNLSVTPRCPFVRAYIERHPEFEDLTKSAR